MSKPTIDCAPNGPLLLKGGGTLIGSDGKEIKFEKMAALCRCGKSAKKPFCDGAHGKAGFTDKKVSDGSKNKKRDYAGSKLTLHYNKELCSHAAQCVSNAPEVFNPKAKPWIQPENADPEKLKATVKKCPSGALSFTENNQEVTEFGMTDEKVTIAKDGPYYVQGFIETQGTDFLNGATKEHYALCRCGESRNKPFCDGYHHDVGFKAD